jgi:hypothetical protein
MRTDEASRIRAHIERHPRVQALKWPRYRASTPEKPRMSAASTQAACSLHIPRGSFTRKLLEPPEVSTGADEPQPRRPIFDLLRHPYLDSVGVTL